jgi:hypothetical protein
MTVPNAYLPERDSVVTPGQYLAEFVFRDEDS